MNMYILKTILEKQNRLHSASLIQVRALQIIT